MKNKKIFCDPLRNEKFKMTHPWDSKIHIDNYHYFGYSVIFDKGKNHEI
jgi:hypothetical protein